MPNQPKPTKAQLAAWREARVQHYAATRSSETLARMLVELEDSGKNTPEFEIAETWPKAVRYLKRGACPVCKDRACETKSLECGQ